MKIISVYLVGLGIYLFGFISFSSAQEILFESGSNNSHISAEEIQDTGEVKYKFGVLTKGPDTIDYYRILPQEKDTSSQLTIELFVPAREEYANFHPNLIVSDPFSTRMIGEMPGNYPETIGGRTNKWPEDGANEESENAVFSR